jgi:hypothetical protein
MPFLSPHTFVAIAFCWHEVDEFKNEKHHGEEETE